MPGRRGWSASRAVAQDWLPALASLKTRWETADMYLDVGRIRRARLDRRRDRRAAELEEIRRAIEAVRVGGSPRADREARSYVLPSVPGWRRGAACTPGEAR